MERDYRAGSVDAEANMERSWGELDNAASPMRSSESSSVVQSGFRFHLSGSGDVMSLQSGDTSPMTSSSGRFTTAALRRSRGGDHVSKDAEEEEEDYGEEEEEEDDDHMRQSWTTEKEPEAMRFLFAKGHVTEEMKEDAEEQEEEHYEHEEEEADDDDDGDDSFGSMEWWVREQRHLARQVIQTEDHQQDDEEEKGHGGGDDSVEKSVREALGLLNGNDAEEEEEQEGEEEGGEEHLQTGDAWGTSGAETAEHGSSYYFDIVQEAMATEWTRDRGYTVEEQEEHEADQEEEETSAAVPQEELVADEWLEAFTAKGRVYYYNRRTRESSWTKPASVLEREATVVDAHEGEETDEEPQEDEDEHYEEENHEHHAAEEDEDDEDEDKDELHERHSFQASLRSSTSSTASSENENAQEESFTSLHSSSASARAADTLFCCFCGSPVRGANGFQFHFSRCETLHHHKLTMSPLYEQFQQMLVLLSEDSTLRAMHYASSFPDATPQLQDDAEPTQQSVRESLVLLRVKHRSSVKPLVHKTAETDRLPAFQPLSSGSSRGRSTTASSKRVSAAATAAAPREPLANRYNSLKQKPTPVAVLNMETCRHCSRSFAEGRLAKHEAVCPRVFGNETAWGRGAAASVPRPSASNGVSGDADSHTQHQQSQRRQDMLRTLQKKRNASLKHTLALSFQEHQASLVECPCCKRKFAPSGAQQHIDICKTVQHRPRNHVPLMKDFAMAS